MLLGAAVLGSMVYNQRLAADVTRLSNQNRALDEDLAEAMQIKSAAADVDAWAASDFFWLEELRRLSERFPSAEDAMLLDLQMQPRLRDGAVVGQMTLKGMARDIEAIEEGEEGLRDDLHEVIGNEATEERKSSRYAWRFSSSLFVAREEN